MATSTILIKYVRLDHQLAMLTSLRAENWSIALGSLHSSAGYRPVRSLCKDEVAIAGPSSAAELLSCDSWLGHTCARSLPGSHAPLCLVPILKRVISCRYIMAIRESGRGTLSPDLPRMHGLYSSL